MSFGEEARLEMQIAHEVDLNTLYARVNSNIWRNSKGKDVLIRDMDIPYPERCFIFLFG